MSADRSSYEGPQVEILPGEYVPTIPLGWQDETLDRGPRMRRVMRVLIAAVDAWRGKRRDWCEGVDW